MIMDLKRETSFFKIFKMKEKVSAASKKYVKWQKEIKFKNKF